MISVTFTNRDRVNDEFISRVGWDPLYSSTPTYFIDWCSQWNYGPNTRGNLVKDVYGRTISVRTDCVDFTPSGMVITPRKISPIEVFPEGHKDFPLGKTFLYASAKVVSRHLFEGGMFTFEATISNPPWTVEAFWWMTVSRYLLNGSHTYKPEWDSHEFGVENWPTCLNVALHGNRSRQTQYPFSPGRYLLQARATRFWLISYVDGKEVHRFFRPRIEPLYPQFWNAVPGWAKDVPDDIPGSIIHKFTWHKS